MKRFAEHPAPPNAAVLRQSAPVVCYPNETLPTPDVKGLRAAREGWAKIDEVTVPAR
jgi:hypothetical protein